MKQFLQGIKELLMVVFIVVAIGGGVFAVGNYIHERDQHRIESAQVGDQIELVGKSPNLLQEMSKLGFKLVTIDGSRTIWERVK